MTEIAPGLDLTPRNGGQALAFDSAQQLQNTETLDDPTLLQQSAFTAPAGADLSDTLHILGLADLDGLDAFSFNSPSQDLY